MKMKILQSKYAWLAGMLMLICMFFAGPQQVYAGSSTSVTATTYTELVNAISASPTYIYLSPADDFGWPDGDTTLELPKSTTEIYLMKDWTIPAGVTVNQNTPYLLYYDFNYPYTCHKITVRGTLVFSGEGDHYYTPTNGVSTGPWNITIASGGVCQVGEDTTLCLGNDTEGNSCVWSVESGGRLDVNGLMVFYNGASLQLASGAVVNTATNYTNKCIELDANSGIVSNGGIINGRVRTGEFKESAATEEVQMPYISGSGLTVDYLYTNSGDLLIKGSVTVQDIEPSAFGEKTLHICEGAEMTCMCSRVKGYVDIQNGGIMTISPVYYDINMDGKISGEGTLVINDWHRISEADRAKITCNVDDQGYHCPTDHYDCIWCLTAKDSGTDTSGSDGLTGSTGAADVTTPVSGDTITSSKASYTVLTVGSSGNTVQYTGTTGTAKTVKIPATVTVDGTTYKVVSVAANAFKGNKKITSVTIGSNVTTIGSKAFCKCTALKTVTLGKNVKTVGTAAFYGCTKLTKFTAGAALTTIKTKAFSGCKVLKTVTMTKSTKLKTIGASAFNGCKKLTTLTICSNKLTKKTVKSALKGSSVKTIKVPAKKVTAYKKYFAKSNSGKTVTVKKK